MRSVLLPMALCVTLCANAAEDPIGRLFFTPQQRSQLDRLRQNNDDEPLTLGSEAQPVTVNGLVQRSSGKDTAWINRSAKDAHNAATARKARGAPEVEVQLPSGQNLNLKAGQTYDPVSGSVSEPYEKPAPAVPGSGAPAAREK